MNEKYKSKLEAVNIFFKEARTNKGTAVERAQDLISRLDDIETDNWVGATQEQLDEYVALHSALCNLCVAYEELSLGIDTRGS